MGSSLLNYLKELQPEFNNTIIGESFYSISMNAELNMIFDKDYPVFLQDSKEFIS